MDVEHELSELMTLLREAAVELAAIEGSESDETVVAGPTPLAAENRSIRAARAHLSRARAREMRVGLRDLRDRARRMVEVGREGGTAPPEEGAGPGDSTGLETAVSAVAGSLADAEDREGIVRVLVEECARLSSTFGGVGVAVRRPDGSLAAEATSDPAVGELVALENDGGGPVGDVLDGVAPSGLQDLGRGGRPGLRRRADALGLDGVLVHGLGPRIIPTALVVYGPVDTLAEGPTRHAVAVLADHARIALAAAARIDRLQRALTSRDVIGQAKGILIERDGLTADAAFTRLLEASQHTNIKLYDVAAWFVGERLAGDSSPAG